MKYKYKIISKEETGDMWELSPHLYVDDNGEICEVGDCNCGHKPQMADV